MKDLLYPSRFVSRSLSKALPLALKLMLLFFVSPFIALGGWIWLLYYSSKLLTVVIALRRLARDELHCPHGHHVALFGKWRCPHCRGIWQGPGHRCELCGTAMGYLVCQSPGCGLAARLPELTWRKGR